MNVFIGVGRIIDVNVNGRLLKFNLALSQEKPCSVPCVLFDPDDEVRSNMEQIENSGKLVWIQGRASTYEFEVRGKLVRKFEIVAYPSSIKPV